MTDLGQWESSPFWNVWNIHDCKKHPSFIKSVQRSHSMSKIQTNQSVLLEIQTTCPSSVWKRFEDFTVIVATHKIRVINGFINFLIFITPAPQP